MQPYFFPYFGHFSLVAACDEWIVFDTCQYTPKSWMNRNRLRRPDGKWCWMTAPLANGSIHIRANEARLLDPARARHSIIGQLSHFRRAPFHSLVVGVVEEAFAGDDDLVALNVRGLAAVCRVLGLPFRYRMCSNLGLRPPTAMGAGDWAPFICRHVGASAYINPVGGRHLFDPAAFRAAGVTPEFIAARQPPPATPVLSVLDSLLWHGPARVRDAVLDYTVIAGSSVGAPALA